jgi:magnesium transporter
MGDSYRNESAGRCMVTRVPIANSSNTVAEARSALSGQSFECVDLICVVDAAGRLAGVVPLVVLFAAPPAKTLDQLFIDPAPTATVDVDQERIASLAVHHAANAIAITDADGKFLGVVPATALIGILRHEHVEDLHRLAGIARETELARHAMEAPPSRRVRDRLPWLAAGLAGSVAATGVMAGFEETLQERVAIAFFVPGLVYLADAVGTQTEAIAVRGLSLSHASIGTLLRGEVRTGLLIGLVLGLAAFAATLAVFSDLRLALTVSLSLLCAAALAAGLGLAFPWLLHAMGKDPAYGSGPIATVVQDILTLLIYFAMARAIL